MAPLGGGLGRGMAHEGGRIPEWALARPKPLLQHAYDLLGAPLRMVLLPDGTCERLHLTSLRAERFASVLPQLKGRVLDVGAGDNLLVKTYRAAMGPGDRAAAESVGVDVVDWGADCVILESAARMPFPDASFDTVCFIACLNHIPERKEALQESIRVLRPGGRVVATMIGRLIGKVGHALWWYSEDKHRDVHEEEEMGLDDREMLSLLRDAGFRVTRSRGFVYGLNRLYVAELPAARR